MKQDVLSLSTCSSDAPVALERSVSSHHYWRTLNGGPHLARRGIRRPPVRRSCTPPAAGSFLVIANWLGQHQDWVAV